MQEEFMNCLERIIREGMEKRDRSVFLSFAKDGGFTVSIDPWSKEVDKNEQNNTIAFDCVLENCHEVGLETFPMPFKIYDLENDEEDSPPQKNGIPSSDA